MMLYRLFTFLTSLKYILKEGSVPCNGVNHCCAYLSVYISNLRVKIFLNMMLYRLFTFLTSLKYILKEGSVPYNGVTHCCAYLSVYKAVVLCFYN